MDDLNEAAKIAITAIVLVVIVTMVFTVVTVGRHYFNTTVDDTMRPIENAEDTDIFMASIYGKPIPVADVWRMIVRINNGNTRVNGNVSSFALKERNAVDINMWDLVSDQVVALRDYMDRKAYIAYSIDERSGMYTMEVSLENE